MLSKVVLATFGFVATRASSDTQYTRGVPTYVLAEAGSEECPDGYDPLEGINYCLDTSSETIAAAAALDTYDASDAFFVRWSIAQENWNENMPKGVFVYNAEPTGNLYCNPGEGGYVGGYTDVETDPPTYTGGDTSRVCKISIACVDTPAWLNTETRIAWSQAPNHSCGEYVKYDWCRNGAATTGKEWTLGWTWNYPEENCCACGKGHTCMDSPGWTNQVHGRKYAAETLHTCNDYYKFGWCTGGALGVDLSNGGKYAFGGEMTGAESSLWGGSFYGANWNWPEYNCCGCGKACGSIQACPVPSPPTARNPVDASG